MTKRRTISVVAAALVMVLIAAAGYAVGVEKTQSADWRTVTIEKADVASDTKSGRALTVNVDGWAYGMENQVPRWIDKLGKTHNGGWPDCLEPTNPGGGPAQNPGTQTFKFAAAELETNTSEWRPVLLVDCRA